ncbi:dihydrolipoamide acetyltransferase family protein [Alkalicoccus daliensis]|uniref:Dihydrolipoamide acetyltransferase component of pyruvate dehydrogenase complex n=1 Tax=Alkalicoccus daliensis TaxID=745820 RepID=A0A1H0B2Z7_9BACI|nr:dihydrolipoamide acetyltransferase family protein [Alkalicoccus daliensis]SDN40038.1 branched-chain alpha-keto acid dehydrogenase E2 component [Alkalicoccus daliensis]
MATEITMPQLGESVTEGTITKWLVSPGDKVNKYDPLAEVMTDKVNAEVPSSFSGTIEKLIAEEDQTIAVGEVICTMNVEGQPEKTPETSKEQPDQETSTSPAEESPKAESDNSSKNRYSPAVMRLAQENDIDLSKVDGSGRGGRITRKDIQALIENGQESGKEQEAAPVKSEFSSPSHAATSPSLSAPAGGQGRTEEIPVSGVRKAIAQNMVQSKHNAPHAWMMVEVDVTNLVKLREQKKNEFASQEGFKLTYLPFFMKAVVDALKKYPQVNAKWAEDKIIRYKDVHLSMAVAADEELYVPVIKNADEKNITGLARALNDIAGKVRTGSLTSQDMQGGTFTLNNTGSFGSIQSQPIINAPQAAILSVESIVKRPVIMENDAIAVRHMVNLCMSLDHRVLDGLICGKFMNDIKTSLESINESNTTIY